MSVKWYSTKDCIPLLGECCVLVAVYNREGVIKKDD